jgi:hypothetical protein
MSASVAAPSKLDRTLKIVHSQQAVPAAVQFAELVVSACCPPCREAVSLAACELAENVAKYGVQHDDPQAGTISVGIHGNVVRLAVTNAVDSPADANRVLTIVGKMSSGASVAELYRARLHELFSRPGAPRAELGLLRLAFEGKFTLRASYQAPLLQIVAERSCEGD